EEAGAGGGFAEVGRGLLELGGHGHVGGRVLGADFVVEVHGGIGFDEVRIGPVGVAFDVLVGEVDEAGAVAGDGFDERIGEAAPIALAVHGRDDAEQRFAGTGGPIGVGGKRLRFDLSEQLIDG